MKRRFLISPPAGAWYQPSWAVPVLGTFTALERPGRLGRILRTTRPERGGWRNSIGLRNPGIQSIERYRTDVIYSFSGLCELDWDVGLSTIPYGCMVEMNIGCPTTKVYMPSCGMMAAWQRRFAWVSVKLPGLVDVGDLCEDIVWSGIRHVHACNTVWRDGSAHSGASARHMSQRMIRFLHGRWPRLTIIAGGGIYHERHVSEARRLGATRFSLCTGLLKPWRIPAMREAAS